MIDFNFCLWLLESLKNKQGWELKKWSKIESDRHGTKPAVFYDSSNTEADYLKDEVLELQKQAIKGRVL